MNERIDDKTLENFKIAYQRKCWMESPELDADLLLGYLLAEREYVNMIKTSKPTPLSDSEIRQLRRVLKDLQRYVQS